MASGKIRKEFDLFANIRPVKSLPRDFDKGIDLVIVRENTEDFYPDRQLVQGLRRILAERGHGAVLYVLSRGKPARELPKPHSVSLLRGQKEIL